MNELQQLLEKTHAYLQQQQQLFGDIRYTTSAAVQRDEPEKPSADNGEQEEHTMATQPEQRIADKEKQHFESATLFGDEPQKTTNPEAAEQPAATPVRDVEPWERATSLEEMQELIQGCQKCPLAATRNKLVFGTGNPNADIMVIGEAPGADEDATGKPFVGRAGQLLTKILAAINLSREEVYIANIIKSRPPGNRRPVAEEVEACEPYLFKQMEFIKPRFILALGLTSVNTLLRANYRMGEIRGKQLNYRGATLIATYHPAALLRNPQWKAATWEDVQLLRRLYDEHRASQG